MKKRSLFFFSLMLVCATICAQQTISLPVAKFKTGDDASWKDRDFNDASWETLKTGVNWDSQGYSDYDGYAWYRIRFTLPKELLENSYYKEQLSFNLYKIDDDDETYLNGKLIGKTKGWNKSRLYAIEANDPAVLWGQENVLAIRVYDGSGAGGNNEGVPFVYVNDLIDGLLVSITPDEKDKKACSLTLKNTYKEAQTGSLQIAVTGSNVDKTTTEKVQVKPGATFAKKVAYSAVIGQRVRIDVTYTDNKTGKTKQALCIPAYILTPAASAEPVINGAKVFGIRPGSPFLFKIAVSGEKPILYEVKNLPQGLSLDKNTGIITGKLDKTGDYKMTFVAGNAKGKCEREFTVKVGETLALTPPMGWNSWNCWGPSVTDAKVRSSAQAL
ncbi:MAG: putative Ig domain-containing protein, partial [Prevotella sp.]|nr:putative Ig domain-containing protein [Prevotella sp.]